MLCEVIANEDPVITGSDIKKKMLDYKVVHVKCGSVEKKYWTECARQIGELAIMEEDVNGNKTSELFTDIKYPWHEPSNSFSHSNTRQPLHTDGSYESNAPDISFFYCVESPNYGGETIFVELNFVEELLNQYFPDLLKRLETDVVTHSKGNDFKTRSIIDAGRITWNYFRCSDCDVKNEFNEFLEKHIIHGKLFSGVKLEVGEALFFMDEQILHGRTSFLGNRWLVKGGIHVGH